MALSESATWTNSVSPVWQSAWTKQNRVVCIEFLPDCVNPHHKDMYSKEDNPIEYATNAWLVDEMATMNFISLDDTDVDFSFTLDMEALVEAFN
ncbi:hypothetical protein LEN26_017470 [Aphanomyces euteiches]|uniref:Uncharacterized protein n=1 Tax=Aphanomyces euteiches TaxID=100861 RepID=A0A6G0WZH3_9STRA|nr:hypothetical protein Ae201684_010226 [Aphanomyces euteiches]KAH9076044.1 hypothetical protein Ae201684P_012534 [Aphanomyces euteiches]KAH9096446.1 hypothetical protein LEN26_017470 [Aphanomyces euteiches]KAH9127834.1 hypothetical protein AeMF1_001910 [Aphanomyces euteiches]KAH9151656.1 hypothetical protein AeRB84_005767 [Aphanomyces euteiches]